MAWFKINLPAKLFLPDIHQTHFAFFTQNQRQPEFGMFGAKLTGDTTKGPPRRGDEIIVQFFPVTVLHDLISIVSSWRPSQAPDSTINFIESSSCLKLFSEHRQ